VVYLDANANGVFDTGDVGIPNVTVSILASTTIPGAAGTSLTTTTTDANGNYTFTIPSPDNTVFSLSETQPAGYNNGTNTVGNGDGTVSGDTISGIHLTTDQVATGYNFGETSPSTINNNPVFNNNNNNTNTNNNGSGTNNNTNNNSNTGNTTPPANPPLAGYVFVDAAQNGNRQGDAGIPNVSLQLLGTGADGKLGTSDDTVAGSAVTDTNGHYSFGNTMPQGLYSIVETQPQGFTDSPATAATTIDVAYPAAGLSEQNFGEVPAVPPSTSDPIFPSDSANTGTTNTPSQTQTQETTNNNANTATANTPTQTQTQSQSQGTPNTQTQTQNQGTPSTPTQTQSQTQGMTGGFHFEMPWRTGAFVLAGDFDNDARDDSVVGGHHHRH
jgi:hypothetical protein